MLKSLAWYTHLRLLGTLPYCISAKLQDALQRASGKALLQSRKTLSTGDNR